MSLVLLSNPPLHLQLDTPSLGRGLGAETEYDLIMTKWETEGVGRGQEESVVVLFSLFLDMIYVCRLGYPELAM